MATRFFSEHFAPTAGDHSTGGAVVAAVADVSTLVEFKLDVGVSGARLRYKKAYVLLSTDMDDTDELGRGLVRIFSDDALAKRMRKAQKQRAETFWTWQERVAAEVTDLEALVAGGDRRGADGPVRG